MERKNELIAYAMDFASYSVFKVDGINRIILHGSIAKGDFNKNSDIDLFFDVDDKKLEKKIKITLESYYKTSKFKEWKLKGIENPFSIIIGSLDKDEWKDLKRAIMNTGIVLYGKYKSEAEKIFQYVLFSFENIKPEKNRVAVYRKLFGFGAGKSKYPGLVEKLEGLRIGKGVFAIPVENIDKLKDYLKQKKISAKVYDIWSDVKIT